MTKQYLTFVIDDQIFGFPIEKVREINRIGEVTKIPSAEAHYSGVMNLRGSIVTVVSLRLKMALPMQENTLSTCTIMVDCGPQKIAIIVDAVESVVNIEVDQIEKSAISQSGLGYIDEIAKFEEKIVMLIDIDKCFMESLDKLDQTSENAAA